MTLMPSETITLKDGRTATIAHVSEADAEAILGYIDDISYESDFLSFGPGEFELGLEEERAFIRGLADASNGMMLKATVAGQIIGSSSLKRSPRSRLRHAAELGLSVRRAFWGLGVGRALCEAAFAAARRVGIMRVSLRVRADNHRAIHLYERLGFVHEGRHVGAFVLGGAPFDELTMALHLGDPVPAV
jgi:RimJ/RimL family protein N-acetyltransferase